MIEIPLPNEQARMEVLKNHTGPITKHGDVDYEAIIKVSDRSVTRFWQKFLLYFLHEFDCISGEF
jgi:SpoVK/Ycf46/Vps4 family AAA+-type ATPase